MNAVVLSDLHIGNRYFISEPLKGFLESLPPQAELILNGDTVDRRRFKAEPQYSESLELIARESRVRRVVWVRGNHDWKYMPPDAGKIEFAAHYEIGKRLFISHGHKFDFIMLVAKPLLNLVRMVHDYRVDLGAERAHVAFAAKKFEGLYRVLRRHVALSAVNFARKNGYEAITCGHTHYVEDLMIGGIRYINTGSWTEPPISYILVNDAGIELRRIH